MGVGAILVVAIVARVTVRGDNARVAFLESCPPPLSPTNTHPVLQIYYTCTVENAVHYLTRQITEHTRCGKLRHVGVIRNHCVEISVNSFLV